MPAIRLSEGLACVYRELKPGSWVIEWYEPVDGCWTQSSQERVGPEEIRELRDLGYTEELCLFSAIFPRDTERNEEPVRA